MTTSLLTIDVAHPPRHPASVEEELDRALQQVRNSRALRVLKVIHGYGSSGRGGSTRIVVRNWAFRRRRSVRAIIDGEHYSLFNEKTQLLRKDVGEYEDPDLDARNGGICLLWVK